MKSVWHEAHVSVDCLWTLWQLPQVKSWPSCIETSVGMLCGS